MKNIKNVYKSLLLIFSSCNPWFLMAQGVSKKGEYSLNLGDHFYLNLFLIMVAAFLVPVIGVLGKTLLLTVRSEAKKEKERPILKSIILIGALGLGANGLLAQGIEAGRLGPPFPKNADLMPYFLGGAILFEALIIIFLLFMINRVLAKSLLETNVPVVKSKKNWQRVWQRMNKLQPIGREADLDTGHNYDGIRELDNITPPWFVAGFVLSILFAIVYMWVYHVSESAPLQIEEYEIAVAEAEFREAEYLKAQVNNVDESNVALLEDDAIAMGENIYNTSCAVCHLKNGGGSVGPNLTDEYTLHGGSLRDIFKSIKYGWVEKGMKAWKDDLSPVQISQVANYIYKLQGTNIAGGKEPQGNLFEEEDKNKKAEAL